MADTLLDAEPVRYACRCAVIADRGLLTPGRTGFTGGPMA